MHRYPRSQSRGGSGRSPPPTASPPHLTPVAHEFLTRSLSFTSARSVFGRLREDALRAAQRCRVQRLPRPVPICPAPGPGRPVDPHLGPRRRAGPSDDTVFHVVSAQSDTVSTTVHTCYSPQPGRRRRPDAQPDAGRGRFHRVHMPAPGDYCPTITSTTHPRERTATSSSAPGKPARVTAIYRQQLSERGLAQRLTTGGGPRNHSYPGRPDGHPRSATGRPRAAAGNGARSRLCFYQPA